MMTTVELLTASRDLISEPERWTQDAYARDIHGEPTDAVGDGAVCWCATGALWSAGHDHNGKHFYDLYEDAVGELTQAAGRKSLVLYNDGHTHNQVLALFDEAIAALGQGG